MQRIIHPCPLRKGWNMLLFLAVESYFVRQMTEEELSQLMDEYGTELLRLCFMYLKDHQLAEDAVQETFLKVYTKYASFRGNSSVKTWITSIAMNVCRDYMRKKSYKERPLLLPDSIDEQNAYEEKLINENAVSFGSTNEDLDSKIAVLNAVSELPEIYRKTILLYYYSGLSTEEIAKVLKCAKATVNVRLKRARDMLKNILT